MPTVIFNLEWMTFNILLAILGIVFAFFLLKSRSLLSGAIFFILWLLFVPNTIYLITDLEHLPKQLTKAETIFQIVIVFQYLTIIILGVLTFFLSLYLFEKKLSKLHFQKQRFNCAILIIINYLIAFGVALGRFERINSWSILISPGEILTSSLNLLQSPEIILVTLLFGSLSNILYFSLKKIIKL